MIAEHRRLLWTAASTVLAATLVAGAAWSPLLAVRSIELAGGSHLSRARVLELAAIARGTRTFLVDEEGVEARLEADPWVLRASVQTTLPSTVRIRVRERRPIAAVDAGGVYRLVAADGVLLEDVTRQPKLPLLSSADPLPQSLSAAAARTLGLLKPRLRDVIDRAVVRQTGRSLRLHMESGVIVEFGSLDDAEAKGEALAGILRWVARNGVRPAVIDVRAPGAPAIHTTGGRGSG